MIAVVCFISVLYIPSGKKSRLFGSIAGRIFTSGDAFAITIWTISEPVGRHKFYHFVFSWFIPTVTFDSVLHTCLLDIHIQRLAQAIGLQDRDTICVF